MDRNKNNKVGLQQQKRKARFKCILDGLSNALPERLLKAFLTAFEMRLRCVCGNAF